MTLTELFRKVLRFISPLVLLIRAPFSDQCIAPSRRTLCIATRPPRQKSEPRSLCEALAACPKTKAFCSNAVLWYCFYVRHPHMTTYIGLIGGGNITETHARAARAIPG